MVSNKRKTINKNKTNKGLNWFFFSYNFLGDFMKKAIILLMVLVIFPSQALALEVSSRSACLMDIDSGRVLFSKDPNNPRLIASITKIMTAILAIESGRLEEEVTVGEEVLTMYGSNIYIELGEKMSLMDLVYGLMLRSGNDAAVVIATFVGGTEENFVKMMNEKAASIGMTNTVFKNPHGLDEVTENKSTAYDMALLSRYASNNDTYMKIVGTQKYTVQSDKKSYLWNNRNKLLKSYEWTTGGKTGYTPRAGRTLVTTAKKDNLHLTVTTLNDGNEYETHEQLYEYAFSNYKQYVILSPKTFKVDQAYYPDKVYIEDTFRYPLTDEEVEDIKVEVKLTKLNNYSDGDNVGIVSVKLDDEEIHSQKVYVKVDKEESKNIFSRIWAWLFD